MLRISRSLSPRPKGDSCDRLAGSPGEGHFIITKENFSQAKMEQQGVGEALRPRDPQFDPDGLACYDAPQPRWAVKSERLQKAPGFP